MSNPVLSACGLLCNECEYYPNECSGCYKVQGSTFWANEMMPTKVCPLFDCGVNTRGYHSCGDCAELPCDTFKKMKDPSITDEQHELYLLERVNRLKALKK